MDYLYENLGDERFQEFCSCLISKEFPNAQAFPVGQPDGGRDSIVFSMDTIKKEFIVFQVKFVRNPNQDRDIHKWLTDIIGGEADKINSLIPKGAKRYYLLTNVKGTAHLDSGSKDKVNKILEDNIKIPSICWWRDDISMLFEKDPLFKWSYPEILNGQDILNLALFNNLNENRERRENVIRSYIADQYEMDNEVKFKQIELQNRIFDLFTDIPIQIRKFNEKDKKLKSILNNIDNYMNIQKKNFEYGSSFSYEQDNKIGAAEFLLHPIVQQGIKKILLEGGPGQGKSTISQYVSQVHRSRLLNKKSDFKFLPDNIKNTPIRLPIKMDLRHIAAWVEKKNPYEEILSSEHFDMIWNKSLESFLIGHIYYHSKMKEFNTNDLIEIFKLSPILLVFDGFDEVANYKVREEVIEFINKGINRLSESCKFIQVIVTSRPAAFSDFVGFSSSAYPYFELTDITPKTISNYLERWIKASKLDGKEASYMRKLVEEKLKMPHLKELTKSPMQLAIFISLLRTRGESLPNKRTALYDSYIELFFNRESEKDSTIRDYRDLIIDIHEYVAWILHSEAELYKNSGIISIKDLKQRLNDYLIKEGHKTDVTEKLFQVVKERVCALVSRVQGTFEFEVQPLREYFCAKYLYKTSPYSPVGGEKTGTLPDRFEAISRNFYWQNVSRFFAGCLNKGELPMLIQKLRELTDDNILKYTNYPRVLTSELLSDYVFTQYPLLLKDVVKIIIDGINIGNIVNRQNSSLNNESIVLLPDECGRKEVVLECFRQLRKFPARDYAFELIGLIKNNPYEIVENWSSYLQEINGNKLTMWLEYALRLEIIHKIDGKILLDIIERNEPIEIQKILQLIISGNRLDIIEKYRKLKDCVYDGILTGKIFLFPRGNRISSLNFIGIICGELFTLSSLIGNEGSYNGMSFMEYILRFYGRRHEYTEFFEFKIHDSIDEHIDVFSKSIKDILLKPNLLEWRNSLENWDALVENGRSVFGEQWNLIVIATLAAGIKSRTETYEEFSDLNNSSISLCKRARSARMKSGNIKYWEQQIQSNGNLKFKLVLLFSWATTNTIIQLIDVIEPLVDTLEERDFLDIAYAVNIIGKNSVFNKKQYAQIVEVVNNNNNISNLLKYLLSLRIDYPSKREFICKKIDHKSIKFREIFSFKMEFLISKYLSNTDDENILAEIKEIYKINTLIDIETYYDINSHRNASVKIPLKIAQRIMNNCNEYPRKIAFIAERSCMAYAYEEIQPVGKIAKNEKWFE